LLSEAKQEMMNAGDLRCIDCHMASYAVREGTVERFHNFKVAQNLPHSCSGGAGGDSPCHDGADRDGLEAKIAKIKGPRKEW
jgi:hypothetical protein